MSDESKATEWWWVDYLEHEMDPGLERDLELLLEHSEEDRHRYEHIRLLREWLRGSDPIGRWPIDERLARVKRNVMLEIQASGAKLECEPERAACVESRV